MRTKVVLTVAGLTAALLGCASEDGRGIGSAAGPWQDDDRATGEPGALLGSFEMTYYWVAAESSYTGTKDTNFYTPSCTKIATVPRKFWDALKLEGTGRLVDGRMVNYSGPCSCGRSPCFEVLDDDYPWGKGVQQRVLEPFRSIAVDKGEIAYGDWVYIAALDGMEMPGDAPWGDFVHDGCMRADDTGSAIVGEHIDFFAALKSNYQILVAELDEHVEVRAAGTRCPAGAEDEEPDEEEPADDDTPKVCYPGAANDWTTCLPLSFPGEPSGYDYPGLLNGNANYRQPIAYLDLTAIPSDTKLAPNFTLAEFAQSSKGRYAVVQPHAVERVQQIRSALGVLKINSGYRSPGYNAGISGSATWSRHMYGDGFDYAPQSATITSGETQCKNKGGTLVEYNTHVHCDWRSIHVDAEFFGAVALGELPDLPLADMTAVLELHDGVWTAPADGFDEGEPLRRWTARDAEGEIIATHIGDSFAAPEGTARVEVLVGAVVALAHDVE